MTEMETIFLKSGFSDIQYCDPVKCAEVFRNVTGSFLYVCLMCSKQEENSIMLENHLISHFTNPTCQYLHNANINNDNDTKEHPILEQKINDIDRSADCLIANDKINENLYRTSTNTNLPEKCESNLTNTTPAKEQQNINVENKSKETVSQPLKRRGRKKRAVKKQPIKSDSSDNNDDNGNNDDNVNQSDEQFDMELEKIEPIKPFTFKCAVCPRVFNVKRDVQQHQKSHKNDHRPYACEICPARFKNSSNLKTHANVHSTERPHKCEFCEKSFANENYAKIHRRIHTGEQPYQCDQCGLAYYTKSDLNIHVQRRHSVTPKFTCEVCSRNFNLKQLLRRHIIRHSNIKAHKCPECPSAFVTKKELKQHSFVHLTEKQFPCSFCDMKFSQSTGRRAHEKRIHKIV